MHRKLSNEQIQEAKELRNKGYTKRQLANLFEVSPTTIWENIYCKHKRIRNSTRIKNKVFSYRKLKSVIIVVNQLRLKDFTSIEVSRELQIPLEEVNYIYAHYPLNFK